MPTYEYECGRCSCRFEIKQGFEDEPQAMCPQCQGRARRIFQSTPVIFKGSGFYITDSRKDKDTETGKGGAESGKSEKGKYNTDSRKNKDTETSKGGAETSKGGTETSKGGTETGKSEKGK